MCGIPRGSHGAPRIIVSGRNLVYSRMSGAQYAYPDGEHNIMENVVKPVYAIIVRRKPHAPPY